MRNPAQLLDETTGDYHQALAAYVADAKANPALRSDVQFPTFGLALII